MNDMGKSWNEKRTMEHRPHKADKQLSDGDRHQRKTSGRAVKLHKLRTGHLFAGAGGGILADLLLGHQPIFAVEIEDYPRKVLEQRQADGVLPFFPTFGDIREFDGTPWRGAVDVLAGGFPCQDISAQGANHGKKLGITGERSGLWREYKRLIGEIEPSFIFAENSPMLRTRGLVTVLKDLASMGYDARWCKLGGWHLGADHKRDRIWVFAYRAGDGLEGRHDRHQKGQGETTIRSMERLRENQVWTDLPAPDAFGIANGMAGKLDRLKAVGNGQIPIVAALAWQILAENNQDRAFTK
jgi:DNA (cytosine-5)-methyltransferase 1